MMHMYLQRWMEILYIIHVTEPQKLCGISFNAKLLNQLVNHPNPIVCF